MEVPWACHRGTDGMTLSVEVWLIHGVPTLYDMIMIMSTPGHLWYVYTCPASRVHVCLCMYVWGAYGCILALMFMYGYDMVICMVNWVCALYSFTFGRSLLHVVPRGLPSPYPLICDYGLCMYVCMRSIEYLGRSARGFPMFVCLFKYLV